MLNIYISVSNDQELVIIDGNLELFLQFLCSLREIEELESSTLADTQSTKPIVNNPPKEVLSDASS